MTPSAAHSAQQGPPQRAWAWPLALAALGAVLPGLLWWWHRFEGIGGADPGMWEAAGRGVSLGDPSPVAPVFPALIAILHPVGLSWERAGLILAWVAFVVLGPATYLLARRLGASPLLAATAGLAALLEPWLTMGSLQCQPDTLTALLFVAGILAGVRWLEAQTPARFIVLVLLVGLLPQAREHAPLVAGGLLVVLVAARGTWKQRLGRLLVASVAVLLAPLALGEQWPPWDLMWVNLRWGEVVRHFFETGTPTFLEGTPSGYREAFVAAYAEGSRLRIAWLHVLLSIHSGWSPWLWLLPGLAGWLLIGRRRWLLLAGFLPLLAVLGGAQQPRHVAVLVPVAAACWLAALGRFRRQERLVLWAVTIMVVVAGTFNLPRAIQDHELRIKQRGQLVLFAEELCERLNPDAIVTGGNPRPLIYCHRDLVLLNHAADLETQLFWVGPLPKQRALDWDRLDRTGWVRLGMTSRLYPVFQRPAPTR